MNQRSPVSRQLTPEGLGLADAVILAMRSVLGTPAHPLALHEPEFIGQEWAYVKECLDTGWVSSAGLYVDRFERELSAYVGAAHAVLTSSGTSALHVCLLLAGVQQGDEVLVPTLTFVATANAVAYCGATPHFVDSETESLGVDAHKLDRYLRDVARIVDGRCINRQTGAVVRALVVMHVFGHPADLDAIQEVAARWGLVLIEDAAESLGSYYRGRHTGNVGLVSALSFNGNKIVTTGGGGAVVTNNHLLGKRAKHLTTTARIPHRWQFLHDEVGYNYRLPNINAALGCAQLEQLPVMLDHKRQLAARYQRAFAGMDGVEFFHEPRNTVSNYWLNAIILDAAFESQHDQVLTALNEAGYVSRPVWTLMHRLPMFEQCPRMDLTVAEQIAGRLINLPSSARLGA